MLHPLSLCSGLVIAMVVSLIFIVLLRYLAGVMVWVMIVLVILVIGYGESAASGFELMVLSFDSKVKLRRI